MLRITALNQRLIPHSELFYSLLLIEVWEHLISLLGDTSTSMGVHLHTKMQRCITVPSLRMPLLYILLLDELVASQP